MVPIVQIPDSVDTHVGDLSAEIVQRFKLVELEAAKSSCRSSSRLLALQPSWYLSLESSKCPGILVQRALKWQAFIVSACLMRFLLWTFGEEVILVTRRSLATPK